MRYLMFGVALAALSTAATAQSSAWGFFNGGMGAGVQGADGAQLLIKCDKPGKKSVFAVVVSPANVAAPLPGDRYESQPVTFRVDGKATQNDNWRFNDKFAMAVNKGNTTSLTRFLQAIDGGSKVHIDLKPLRLAPVSMDFNITGAKEAIAKVYESCKDDNPLG